MFTAKKLPKQRVTLSKKLENGKQMLKDTVDHLCEYADGYNSSDALNQEQMESNYRLYNNIIDQRDLEREFNVLGIEVGQYKDNVKAYNKTYNKIQVLLGEELKRKMDFRAVIINSTGIKEKEVKRTELLRSYIENSITKQKQRILKKLEGSNPAPDTSQAGSQEDSEKAMEEHQRQLQSEVDKILNPDEIDRYMSTEYQDAREIMVQKIINYLVRDEEVREKMNDSFKHGLLSGGEFCWTGIVNGEPVVEILNPLNVFYHKSPEIKYVQDGQYAGYTTVLTTSQVLSRYGEDLTEDQAQSIEEESSGVNGMNSDMKSKQMKYHNHDIEFQYKRSWIGEDGSYGQADGYDWEVTHAEWMSWAKVGFLSFEDEDGEPQVDMVSESFPIPEGSTSESIKGTNDVKKTVYTFPSGETLEWKWIPEVWEGTRIGSDIYVNLRKKAVQFRSQDNPYKVRLGYHGIIYNNMNAPSVSIMDRMKPYQYLYFVVMHKLKKMIARSRGTAYSIDLSMIDERMGLEKTLYYLDEMDLDLFNSLQNADQAGAHQRGKVKGSTNRSNIQDIQGYIQLLQQLDVEIGEAAGVTKQREGAIGAYETVGNAQQSITQSSHITEIYFHLHSKLWEKVMDSMVQVTQYAWKGRSITKQFVLDDLSRGVINISGDELFNSDFGIFVSNTIQDAELLDVLKQMALPILQNEGKLTDIVKIYKSLSGSELEREFQQQEKEREQRAAQQQEAERQIAEQQIAAAKEAQAKLFAHELELKAMDIAAQIKMKEIDVFKFQDTLDANQDGIPDPLQLEKLRSDNDVKNKKMDMDDRHHKDKVRLEEKKIAATKAKASSTPKK